MNLNLGIVAEFLVASALITGGLAIIGFPIKALLLDGPDGRSPVPSMVIGMAVIQLLGWYWMRAGGEGLRTLTVVLLVAGAAGSVVAVVRRGVPWPRLREYLPTGVAAAGIALVFFIMYGSIFTLPFHTTASIGNLDAASYSIVGQHLVNLGFGDPGQLGHVGAQAKADGFGSTVLLGAASAVMGTDVWKLTLPLMFVFVVLAVVTLTRLLTELFPDAPVQSALAAVAGSASLLFLFIVGHYFLGQVMAMAVMPILGVAALQAPDRATLRSAARLAGSVTVVVVVFVSHYVHMLAPALLLMGAGGLAAAGRQLRTALPRIAGVLGGGLIVGLALTPDLVIQGINRTRALTTVVAGFALQGFLPSQIAGALDSSLIAPYSVGDYSASFLLLAGFVIALIALRRRRGRAVGFAGAVVALILLSYLAVYLNEGVSYRQWKWITFFAPLFAALVFLVLCMALTDRAVAQRVRGAVPASWVALSALAATLFVVSGFPHTPRRPPFTPPLEHDQAFIYVDPGLSDLATNPKLAKVGAVNLDVVAWWETMWGIYFLRDHQVWPQQPSYYGASAPTADWTVLSRSDAVTGPSVEVLNDRFQLEPRWTGPTSTAADGLEAQVTPATTDVVATAGTPIQFKTTLVNTGTSAWLASGGAAGDVNLGGRLVTARGRTVDNGVPRQSVAPGRTWPIPPGATVNTAVEIRAPKPGRYRLELQMVSEDVGWFGPSVTVDLTVKPAN